MANDRQLNNRVKQFRQQRGWSQEELARRAGISRPAVSAIEIHRLVPSVAAALALAEAFACRLEELFGIDPAEAEDIPWAWPPAADPCRFWHARVGDRVVLFPVEATVAGVIPHDGVLQQGVPRQRTETRPENTLVMAGCDPAAAMLVNEYARASGFRLLVFQRSSRQALELLRRGLVDVAGLHLATEQKVDGNAQAVRATLGSGYSLLQTARWQEGVALRSGGSSRSLGSLLRSRLRWVGREPGSGARDCQDELLRDHAVPRRLARDHRGVAEAVRCGWADVGVCVRLVCEEMGLGFIPVRNEAYDLCFSTSQESDPRVRALIQVVRSPNFRGWLSELPGSSASGGELVRLP